MYSAQPCHQVPSTVNGVQPSWVHTKIWPIATTIPGRSLLPLQYLAAASCFLPGNAQQPLMAARYPFRAPDDSRGGEFTSCHCQYSTQVHEEWIPPLTHSWIANNTQYNSGTDLVGSFKFSKKNNPECLTFFDFNSLAFKRKYHYQTQRSQGLLYKHRHYYPGLETRLVKRNYVSWHKVWI